MKYKELQEPCKSCYGCLRLENPNFSGDKNCEYAQIEKTLNNKYIQEKIKNYGKSRDTI